MLNLDRHMPDQDHRATTAPAQVTSPRPKTAADVSAILRTRPRSRRCDPKCPGWGIFDSDSMGLEIEACGECNHHNPDAIVNDDECALLGAARRALAKEIAPMTLGEWSARRALRICREWAKSTHDEDKIRTMIEAITTEALDDD